MASMPRAQEGSSKARCRRTAWPSASRPIPGRQPGAGVSVNPSIAVLSNNCEIVANGFERSYGALPRGFAAHPKAVYSFSKEIGLLPNLQDDEARRAVF
jgi:hypothetical protein